MAAFEAEACRRLPLAEACLRLLDYVLRDDFLAGVFERQRGASYEKVISFPVFVHLIADALLEHHGSGHQSFTRAQELGILEASVTAAYGKLGRTPLSLSCGLLAEATPRLLAILPPPAADALPASLRAFSATSLDGKKIKYVAKRLKALRQVKGHVLGGKLVAAQDSASGLAIGFSADPDGEAGDAPLVPAVLAQVRAVRPGPRLWVADRGFCDLVQPRHLTAHGDHYVLRYNAKVSFTPDPSRPARSGHDAQGRAFREEWGWLGKGKDRIEVRRLTLDRPGDEAIRLVTDLLDGDQYPAVDILAIYLRRWGIERMFQEITEVFHLRQLIGSTPEATVFQAAFCFLLYNVIVVLRAYLATAARPVATISGEKLFLDLERDLVAWTEVIGPEQTAAVLGPPLTAAQLRRRLRQLLRAAWTDLWLKAPPKKQPTKHPDKEYLKGGHNSVYRLLRDARLAEQQAAQQRQRGKPPKKSPRRKPVTAGAERC